MLYTGKGDKGTTTAFGCNQQRISKSSELPEALGSLDELNAFLGFVKMRAAAESHIATALRDVQETLFIIQAEVAGADKRVGENAVKDVEKMLVREAPSPFWPVPVESSVSSKLEPERR